MSCIYAIIYKQYALFFVLLREAKVPQNAKIKDIFKTLSALCKVLVKKGNHSPSSVWFWHKFLQCYFSFSSSNMLHYAFRIVGKQDLSYLIDIRLGPLLTDTYITDSSLVPRDKNSHNIGFGSDTPPGGILYKVVYRERPGP